MKCPGCGATDSRVLDSRPIDDGASVKRRRECNVCGKRFNTYEVVETTPVVVIKKDGSREFFDRHKLTNGITRACYKRKVDVNAIVSEIENELNSSLAGEVDSSAIGEMVMERLKPIDEVAYIRFASVYRRFQDVNSFMREISKFLEE